MVNNQSAFSLLELLIVLVLIGIMLGISLPALQNFSLRTKDQVLQATLLQAIHVARQQARIQRVPIGLCASKDQKICAENWQHGMLIFLDKNANGLIQDAEQIIAIKHLPASHGSLHLRLYPHYRNYLLFLPSLLDNNTDATFWHCHAEKDPPIWAIMLGKTGRARAAYPNKQGVIKDSHGKLLGCDDSTVLYRI